MLPQRCNVPGIQETFREMLKENVLKRILYEKVVFVLKAYDLTITNVDPLGNYSNHKAMFPEYSKNIPRTSVSKIFQGYPQKIVKLRKRFHEVKKFKKLFFGLSC